MAGVKMGADDLNEGRFPSNSKTKKMRPKSDKSPVEDIDKNTQVLVKSGVKRKKKSLGKKLSDSLFETDDIDNIGQYVLHDIIIPEAKNILYNVVVNTMGMSLFGNVVPKNLTRNGSRSVVNYRGASESRNRPNISNRARATHDFDDVVMESKWEAEDVLGKMVEYIDIYDQCTLHDMYDMLGETATFADKKWGWTNLSSASVRRVRDGYKLMLPRTEAL